MDTGPNAHHRQASFPVDRPMDALRQDHALVRRLFSEYRETTDLNVKKDIGPRLLLLLEMHTGVEDAVFYPRVRDVAPALVDQCSQDHQRATDLVNRLKGMDEGDSQAEQLFRQLADAILKHIDIEEQQLFPRVQQANLDLHDLGLEMQSFEINVLGLPAQGQQRPGARQ